MPRGHSVVAGVEDRAVKDHRTATLVALAIAALLVVPACGMLVNACSGEPGDILRQMSHLDGAVPDLEPGGEAACWADVDYPGDRDAALDHYRTELVADGWAIVRPEFGDLTARRSNHQIDITVLSAEGMVRLRVQ